MSKSDSPTASDVYEQHGETVEEIAEDDGPMGAAARAVIRVAQEDDDDE